LSIIIIIIIFIFSFGHGLKKIYQSDIFLPVPKTLKALVLEASFSDGRFIFPNQMKLLQKTEPI